MSQVTRIVHRRANPGQERQYEHLARGMLEACSRSPGYLFSTLIPPRVDGEEFHIVQCFTNRSVDGVLDTVGEALFPTCVAALRPGGVLSLVGAVGGSAGHFDLWDLIRPITLTGYSSETLDGPALRRAITDISGWLANGKIGAPTSTHMPLADAQHAHALLEGKGVNGRIILTA